MSLSDELARMNSWGRVGQGVTEDMVVRGIDEYRELVSWWRVYPDRFVDFLCSLNPKNTFHLFFFQRFMLRVFMRYKYVYAVFTRGFSKSFLAVLTMMIKAILYPGASLFVCSDTKTRDRNGSRGGDAANNASL